MATTSKLAQGTRTSLTVTGLSTLASATYVASSAYNANTNQPLDVVIEVNVATTNTPAGNKQVSVFAQASLDGTNFQSGPTSGTTATDEPDLTLLGVVPMNTTTTTHTKMFSLYNAFGFIPKQFKIVLKNELGVALTSGTVYTAEISGQSV
jgi:hypothetical protein